MTFSPRELHSALNAGPSVRRYVVAYSGGCDSTALLHALATLRDQLHPADVAAIHVDHQWHPDSAQWAQHCCAVAHELGVSCTVLTLTSRNTTGESREAAARADRYAILRAQLRAGDALLTAHHREDQAETLLLQLLRGGGPRGLAAMPVWTELGREIWHGRPLLHINRNALRDYATHYDLLWIEDPSNFDTDLDRNYLRQALWPAVVGRWPGAAATLTRAATLQAEAAELLDHVARADLTSLGGHAAPSLSVSQLMHLTSARRRNVLRAWIAQRGLPLPSHRQLTAIESDILGARWDATPVVEWPGARARRFRDHLYVVAPEVPIPVAWQADWNMMLPLPLPAALGALHADHVTGRGLRTMACRTAPVTVRFRVGGERFKPAGSAHSRDLKTLFQEWSVPPWQRARIPLLFVGRELAYVGGHGCAAEFCAGPGEPGLDVTWVHGEEKSRATLKFQPDDANELH